MAAAISRTSMAEFVRQAALEKAKRIYPTEIGPAMIPRTSPATPVVQPTASRTAGIPEFLDSQSADEGDDHPDESEAYGAGF
jgi:hypothetical protein